MIIYTKFSLFYAWAINQNTTNLMQFIEVNSEHESENSILPGGGGGTPILGQYGYVPRESPPPPTHTPKKNDAIY